MVVDQSARLYILGKQYLCDFQSTMIGSKLLYILLNIRYRQVFIHNIYHLAFLSLRQHLFSWLITSASKCTSLMFTRGLILNTGFF
ncbi:hypothetical protein XELAEV_18001208mg [Xenopus laevis]|nr:hypothetical protein XELAEV_18001208mg [Xenopus laevis]